MVQEPSAKTENRPVETPTSKLLGLEFCFHFNTSHLNSHLQIQQASMEKTISLQERQQLFPTQTAQRARIRECAAEQGQVSLHQDFEKQRDRRRNETQTFITTRLSCPGLSKLSGV